MDHARGELEEGLLLVGELPIDPRELVVLAVRVVVAALRSAELVAVADHRHSLREEKRRQEVAFLPLAQGIRRRIVSCPLGAAVPAQVVAFAVAVFLEVCLVVFFVVADEIVEREAVVRGDEVDARGGLPAGPRIQVIASSETGRELGHRPAVAAPEPAHRISILPIPLGPQHREIADLIPALAEIPRLRNQLHLRQHWILMDDVEERAEAIHLEQLASERARQVEPEAVDVHLDHPVPQAVHDELQHLRALHVQRVPAAGEVHVVPVVIADQTVVRRVVYPFER